MYPHLPTLKSISLPLQRHMSTAMTTSISVMNPARTSQSHGMTASSKHPRHTLNVDLGDAHDVVPVDMNSDHKDTMVQRTEAFQVFLGRLRSIVEQDCAQPEGSNEPRIDAVRFEGLNSYEIPGGLTWKTLDGLQPRHLELHCGWDESCDVEPLDKLQTPWPLESIFISGACGINLTSKYMHSITTLTLNYCCSMSVTPSPEPSALRHLTILQNDAIDMFISMRRDSDVAANVHTLKIDSTNGCDFTHAYEPFDFAKTLQQCTSVLSLDLALIEEPEFMIEPTESPFDHIRHLPAYFPCNVEHLRFRASPSLADDMSSWLRCAADPTWLPRLKTISFHLDVLDKDHGTSMSPSTQTPAVVTEFLDTLSARHPAVDIQ